MAKPKVLATISNLDFIFDSQHTIHKVEANEGYGFIIDNVECSKPLFVPGEDLDRDHCGVIVANKAYNYAISSAMINICGKILESRVGEEKKEEKPASIKEVNDAMNKFKEENKDNPKFITTKTVLQPATRYYSGKQGMEIAEAASLNKLSDEDLAAISAYFNGLKDGASSKIKDEKLGGWVSERTDYTPEGWREIQRIKYETLHNIGKIENDEYTKKMKWIEEFDFHPGWNFESKIAEKIESINIDKLSDVAIATIAEFNKEFAINAINKDAMLDELNL